MKRLSYCNLLQKLHLYTVKYPEKKYQPKLEVRKKDFENLHRATSQTGNSILNLTAFFFKN
jgi:ribosomal protein L34